MARFKDGQKVICTGMWSTYDDKLTIGAKYTVVNSVSGWIQVRENGQLNSYEEEYFRPAKKGEKALKHDNSDEAFIPKLNGRPQLWTKGEAGLRIIYPDGKVEFYWGSTPAADSTGFMRGCTSASNQKAAIMAIFKYDGQFNPPQFLGYL